MPIAMAGGNILVSYYLRPSLSGTRQASHPEKDEDSMTSFMTESFDNVDGRGFWGLWCTVRKWKRILQYPGMNIDNQVP